MFFGANHVLHLWLCLMTHNGRDTLCSLRFFAGAKVFTELNSAWVCSCWEEIPNMDCGSRAGRKWWKVTGNCIQFNKQKKSTPSLFHRRGKKNKEEKNVALMQDAENQFGDGLLTKTFCSSTSTTREVQARHTLWHVQYRSNWAGLIGHGFWSNENSCKQCVPPRTTGKTKVKLRKETSAMLYLKLNEYLGLSYAKAVVI